MRMGLNAWAKKFAPFMETEMFNRATGIYL
jgi:hypothetical protein